MGEDEIRGPALSPGSAKCDPVLLCQVDGKRRFFPAGTGKQHGYRNQGHWAAPGAGRNGGSMNKRVMCVHTELVREGSVLYEGGWTCVWRIYTPFAAAYICNTRI